MWSIGFLFTHLDVFGHHVFHHSGKQFWGVFSFCYHLQSKQIHWRKSLQSSANYHGPCSWVLFSSWTTGVQQNLIFLFLSSTHTYSNYPLHSFKFQIILIAVKHRFEIIMPEIKIAWSVDSISIDLHFGPDYCPFCDLLGAIRKLTDEIFFTHCTKATVKKQVSPIWKSNFSVSPQRHVNPILWALENINCAASKTSLWSRLHNLLCACARVCVLSPGLTCRYFCCQIGWVPETRRLCPKPEFFLQMEGDQCEGSFRNEAVCHLIFLMRRPVSFCGVELLPQRKFLAWNDLRVPKRGDFMPCQLRHITMTKVNHRTNSTESHPSAVIKLLRA